MGTLAIARTPARARTQATAGMPETAGNPMAAGKSARAVAPATLDHGDASLRRCPNNSKNISNSWVNSSTRVGAPAATEHLSISNSRKASNNNGSRDANSRQIFCNFMVDFSCKGMDWTSLASTAAGRLYQHACQQQ